MSGTGYTPPADHPVFVAGVAVNTSGSGYHGALGVRVRNIIGWIGEGVEVRDTREARPGMDGEFADTQVLGGRTITFQGTINASSYADLQARKLALAAVWMGVAKAEGVVKLPAPATVGPSFTHSDAMTGFERVTARIAGGGVVWGERFGTWGQRWQVSIRASAPQLYNDVVTSTDSITTGTAARTVAVDQSGTYETPVTMTATGPTGTSWNVFEPLSGIVVGVNNLALASGESVAIDASQRRLTWTALYYRARTQRSDIVAGWMLNESSGTVADNIQGDATYDLTYTGGFTLNQSGHAAGVASVALNGSTGYLNKAYVAGLNTNAVTMEGWAKMSASGVLVSCMSAGYDAGFYLVANPVFGTLLLEYGASVPITDNIFVPLGVAPNTWFHVAFTIKAYEQRLYVNGDLVGTNDSYYVKNTTQTFNMGRLQDGPQGYVTGNLGPWFMFSSALSPTEIKALYDASAATMSIDAYQFLDPNSRWANLGAAPATFTFSSSGIAAGSKLNVSYRDARV